MKIISSLLLIAAAVFFLPSCTKTESDFTSPAAETITLKSSVTTASEGTSITFTVTSSATNTDVTADSKVFVNGTVISSNSYTFSAQGTYAVHAERGSLSSKVITITVVPSGASTGYVHNILVEEYSGTWCGNCPRILYGVDLLHQQTQQAIVVGIHLFNGDPFITSQGNDLAALRGVSGVPAGHINRTINWNGPQYENVPQAVNQIQPYVASGIAISSAITGSQLNITVGVGYKTPVQSATKLTVYLVEDKLSNTQQNYSANLYGGLASIPNFQYNGVLRAVVSTLSGDAIPNTGSSNSKTYTLTVPANVANIANTKIVAFVTDANGTVLNAQQAKVGETKPFEKL